MVASSMLRHLINDDDALENYSLSKINDFEDIKRRLFLMERKGNQLIPDHHYRLLQERSFDQITTFSDLIGKGIYQSCESLLTLDGQELAIQSGKQHLWQDLVTQIPPLVLQTAFLAWKKPLADNNISTCQQYYRTFLIPNFRYTAIVGINDKDFNQLVEKFKGFQDLHMHLNGSTETDNVWQDHLAVPDKIYEELRKGYLLHPKVREQFDQESHFLDPIKFRNKLITARRIRTLIHDIIFGITIPDRRYENINSILFGLNDVGYDMFADSAAHPFLELTEIYRQDEFLICPEALFYVMVFSELRRGENSLLATLFHYYLLILGLCNRLLVQQVHQNGFEQFQKNTLNGLREWSEEAFEKRFLQMQGNRLRNLNFLEGRFSPKESSEKNVKLLTKIQSGWLKHLRTISALSDDANELRGFHGAPKLRLIAHFIKQSDEKPDEYIRHKSLRYSLRKKAIALSATKLLGGQRAALIVGIDAASSEFDTNPEVFAPVFRLLRREGFKAFTFHAGEDFHHLISGLRAVFEAISFNHLSQGDRIGHATAAGLSSVQWLTAIGERLLIRRGEWLDNLIFVHHLITSFSPIGLLIKKEQIEKEIVRLAQDVYQDRYTLAELTNAWLLRKFCPLLLLSDTQSQALDTGLFNEDEWREINDAAVTPNVKRLVSHYHSQSTRGFHDQIIELDLNYLFSSEDLTNLQLSVLAYMATHQIVIETLPTSNVRIGHHQGYKTYHLWNWLLWRKQGKSIPRIILGSDDTGIFVTNIYNEYANIYHNLAILEPELGDPIDQLLALNQDAVSFRFD